jgi:hypothetical protein
VPNMSPQTWLMVAGGLTWLAGELWGVKSRRAMDTTSEWVWWLEAKWWPARLLVAVFVVSLFGHFLWKGALLP